MLGSLGVVTLLVAVTLGGIRVGLAPASWKPAENWLGLLGAAAGGATTLAGAIYDGWQGRVRTRREEIARLIEALKWAMHHNDSISPFDLGFAVWTPRRDLLRRWTGRQARLKDSTFRARSRNRHAATGITWTVGKGTIGRCIETKEVVGTNLDALWGRLRGCDKAAWLAEPEVEVRQKLTYEEFKKAQGSGTVLTQGHLNYVLAVPILAPSGGGVRGCVALDMPASLVPAGLSEGHYIVDGLRGVADVLGSSSG